MKIQHRPHWANIYLLTPFLWPKTKFKKGLIDGYAYGEKKKSGVNIRISELILQVCSNFSEGLETFIMKYGKKHTVKRDHSHHFTRWLSAMMLFIRRQFLSKFPLLVLT